MYENLKGKTISFEGGEGAGKSTVLKMLIEYLQNQGVDCTATREPGGNKISEQIRDVIVSDNNTNISPETEALLFAASRAQFISETIKPLLKTDKTIFIDRFVDSSYVYQGFVRNLGIDRIKQINEFATGGFMPNLTIFFDVPPEIGFERIKKNNRSTNRLDNEGLEFHKKVYRGYKMLASNYPQRIKTVDATKPPEEVLAQILEYLLFVWKIMGLLYGEPIFYF